jgi:hypothetical protein
VTGIWALAGDCPVGECTIEQTECNLIVICAPLVELLFTGSVVDHNLTFSAPVAACEATLDESGLLQGTCDVGCSFTATPGPSQETGWGCYLGDMPYGCVCDYEGTGDHSVAPKRACVSGRDGMLPDVPTQGRHALRGADGMSTLDIIFTLSLSVASSAVWDAMKALYRKHTGVDPFATRELPRAAPVRKMKKRAARKAKSGKKRKTQRKK